MHVMSHSNWIFLVQMALALYVRNQLNFPSTNVTKYTLCLIPTEFSLYKCHWHFMYATNKMFLVQTGLHIFYASNRLNFPCTNVPKYTLCLNPTEFSLYKRTYVRFISQTD